MRITVLDKSSTTRRSATLQLSSDTEMGTLKMMVEVEFGIPACAQELHKGSQTLSNSPTARLNNLGVKDNDVLHVVKVDPSPMGNMAAANDIFGFNANNNEAMIGQQTRALMDRYQRDSGFASSLKRTDQRLASALESQNEAQVSTILTTQLATQRELLRTEQQKLSLILTDPESVAAQEYLLDSIRRQRIDESLAQAQEFLPESFGNIVMLHVALEINNTPVVAMVDCGAQATIMSQSCAERTNMMKSVDNRFSGVAKGVGSSKILGRVHLAQIKCGDLFIPSSIIVLEGENPELLLGLDLLRRYQCQIDLKNNCLRFDERHSVRFLSEAEIARHYNQTPTVVHPKPLPSTTTIGSQHQPPPVLGVPHAPDAGASYSLTATQVVDKSKVINLQSTNNKSKQPPLGTTTTTAPPTSHHHHGSHRSSHPPSTTTHPSSPPPNAAAAELETEKVKRLAELGFPEARARIALREANGNVELAAARLFQDSGLMP